MRKFALAIAALALVAFVSSDAWAASSKFAARVTGVIVATVSDGTDGGGTLTIGIKTANKSDLLVGVSLQSTVLTDTTTKGKNGETSTSVAEGVVTVCLAVSGVSAADIAPDCVTFESRKQTLQTKLSGIVTCPGDNFCSITDDEIIRLLLETMSANHFNFVVRNVSSGNHTVTATITAETDVNCSGNDLCAASVAVGPGSITIEEVRATNDGDTIIFD